MDKIICYTSYLPEGSERDIAFEELLLNDKWADGRLECPDEVFCEVGGINHKLSAKQNYEFLLRVLRKYPLKLKAVGVTALPLPDGTENFHSEWGGVGRFSYGLLYYR